MIGLAWWVAIFATTVGFIKVINPGSDPVGTLIVAAAVSVVAATALARHRPGLPSRARR